MLVYQRVPLGFKNKSSFPNVSVDLWKGPKVCSRVLRLEKIRFHKSNCCNGCLPGFGLKVGYSKYHS